MAEYARSKVVKGITHTFVASVGNSKCIINYLVEIKQHYIIQSAIAVIDLRVIGRPVVIYFVRFDRSIVQTFHIRCTKLFHK
jgi:hypothetical protein